MWVRKNSRQMVRFQGFSTPQKKPTKNCTDEPSARVLTGSSQFMLKKVHKLLEDYRFQDEAGSVRFGYGSGVERSEGFRFSVPVRFRFGSTTKEVLLCFSTI